MLRVQLLLGQAGPTALQPLYQRVNMALRYQRTKAVVGDCLRVAQGYHQPNARLRCSIRGSAP
jgi:hypothetical protein